MARFDVYRNPGAQADHVPYLVDVQSEVLSALDTRIVIPLRRLSNFPQTRLPNNLMPVVTIAEVECILETSKLAAVPVRILKSPIDSLAANHFEITGALDFLFQGF